MYVPEPIIVSVAHTYINNRPLQIRYCALVVVIIYSNGAIMWVVQRVIFIPTTTPLCTVRCLSDFQCDRAHPVFQSVPQTTAAISLNVCKEDSALATTVVTGQKHASSFNVQ